MSTFRRKITLTTLFVFCFIVGVIAIVELRNERAAFAFAEEINSEIELFSNNNSPLDVITSIQTELQASGTSILAELRKEKEDYSAKLIDSSANRRVLIEKILGSIDESISNFENEEYASKNNKEIELMVSNTIETMLLKNSIAATAALFRARGWVLAAELLWYNKANNALDMDYFPINANSIIKAPQIAEEVAPSNNISSSYEAKTPGILNGLFESTAKGDAHNALGSFYYKKYYASPGMVKISIIDRYDWAQTNGDELGDKIINVMFQAQEEGVLTPFYTNIDLVVPGYVPFLWDYVDGGVAITGFINESMMTINPPKKIYNLKLRPRDGVTPAIINITTIADGAFEGENRLISLSLPDTVTHIGENAFSGCLSLASLELGDYITYIGVGAFKGCNNLNISISNNNMDYRSENNIVYNKSGTKIIASGKISGNVLIPQTVTEIYPFAFYGKSEISTVHIYGAPFIRERAFSDCQNLRNVYFYSFTLPRFGSNPFINDSFTMYSPHALREQYMSYFDQNVVTASSIPITVTLKDGNVILRSLNVYFGDFINISKPIKAGYTFMDWYENSNFVGAIFRNGDYYTMTTNKTFYARFSSNVYTVTFDKSGGSGGTSEISVSTGEWIPAINIPTRELFLFDGYFDENGVRYYHSNGEPIEYLWDKIGNITLYAQWISNYYTVTYNNIVFEGQTANFIVKSDAGSSYADKFTCGETLHLSSIVPYFETDSAYSPQMRFLGWYDSNGFTHRVNEARANITVYAKWRYDYDNLTRSTTYTITDDGAFSQNGQYDTFYIGFASDNMYNNLKALKINYLAITLKIRLWEVNDGYQEIYIYGGNGSGNLLWSKTNIEHGGTGKSTSPSVYIYEITLPLDNLIGVDYLYIRYSAHGAGKDDWKTDKLYCEFSYVIKESDRYDPKFYWYGEDPFK